MGLPETAGFENDWVEFGLGPILLKLTPLRPGEVSSRNQVAGVFSTANLDATLSALKEKGVTVTRPPADEFTGRSSEILDPDGYRIIIFQSSELHPDEEWVPNSRVDELVRNKLAARRKREKSKSPAKSAPKKKPAPKKPAPKKTAPKKPAPKKAAPKKPAPRKAAPKKPTPKRTARKRVSRKKKAHALARKSAKKRTGKKRGGR